MPDKKRKHPVYIFYNKNGNYLFEARYGGKTANALQRGIWTFTNRNTAAVKVLLEGHYRINNEFLEAIKKLSLLKPEKIKDFLVNFV